jgi:hypothetical protein
MRGGILAGSLTDRGAVTLDIEQIVRNLESFADRGTVSFERGLRFVVCPTQYGTADTREFEKRSGLHGLDQFDVIGVVFHLRGKTAFSGEIKHLAASHAADARRARKRRDKFNPNLGIWVNLRPRHNIKGERQKSVAGKDRGGFVECHVGGRTTAPQPVIVHGWQIVVNQRITVDALQGRGHHQRLTPWHGE